MKKKPAWLLAFGVGFIMLNLYPWPASADDDGHRRRRRDFHREREHHERDFMPVDNPTYKEQCGACHFAYPPDSLPSGSWRAILSRMENHNGTEVVIDAATYENVAQYLDANAAEKSGSSRSAEIMRSLDGQTPTRITDVPYIRRKHHDIPAEVFKRESIGSFSNCVACHTTAEQGIFDDDYVRIPN